MLQGLEMESICVIMWRDGDYWCSMCMLNRVACIV